MNKNLYQIYLNGNEFYRSYVCKQRALARCEMLSRDRSVYVELWHWDGDDMYLLKYWN